LIIKNWIEAIPSTVSKIEEVGRVMNESNSTKVSLQSSLSVCLASYSDNRIGEVQNISTSMTHNLAEALKSYHSSLVSLENITKIEFWNDFSSSLLEGMSFLKNLQEKMEGFKSYTSLWPILILSTTAILALTTIFLVAASLLSRKKDFRFVDQGKSYMLLGLELVAFPLFSFLVAGVWFLCSLSLALGVLNADFCYGEITHKNVVSKILNVKNISSNNHLHKIVNGYLHGCEESNNVPLPYFESFTSMLNESLSISIANNLTEGGDFDLINDVCGYNVSQEISATLGTTSEVMKNLNYSLNEIQSKMSCHAVASPLREYVYETTCISTMKYLIWCFSSLLAISVFGIIMISLRSVTQRIVINPVDMNIPEKVDENFRSDYIPKVPYTTNNNNYQDIEYAGRSSEDTYQFHSTVDIKRVRRGFGKRRLNTMRRYRREDRTSTILDEMK